MDRMIKAISNRAHIRVTTVDVTQAAKTLEGRHLCGPVAGRVLGEGVAAAAILSADSATASEALLLQVRVDGPLKGVVVEAAGTGDLRGYTTIKILEEADGFTPVRSESGLGTTGTALIQRSTPGRLLGQTTMPFTPPDFRLLLARYYNQSLQRPAGVELTVCADAGGVLRARALVAERMPDGKQEDFIPVLEALQEGRIRLLLEADVALPSLAGALGLDDLAVRETRELRFKCRCSRAKALESFATLASAELDGIAYEGKPQRVVCHMCGADYLISAAEVAR